MNGPKGCETLPLAAGAAPEISLLTPPLPVEETTLSFEELLQVETVEVPAEEAEDEPQATALSFFPFVAPPLLLPPVEHKLPPALPPAPPATEQIAEKPALSQPKPDGMPAAQQPSMIFTNSVHEEETARAQDAHSVGIEYIESPGFDKKVMVTLPEGRVAREDAPAHSLLAEAAPVAPTKFDRDFAVAELFQAEKPHGLAAKAAEAIEAHVQLVRTTGQERLEVVVRPDVNTALHLSITKVEGLIQVQARCDRGDFALLDAHWGHVQSSLAAQGIRVEPLQPTLSWEHDSGSRQGSSRRDQEQPPRGEFFLEQDSPNSRSASPRSKAAPGQNRGWQRWA